MASEPHSAAYFNDQRDFWFNDDWLDLMAARLSLSEVSSALDVGAGQGHWTLLLAPRLAPDARIVGVEREPAWRRRAEERARQGGLTDRVSFVPGTAESLPVGDGDFDLVTCQTVLMHVADAASAIAEMVRVVRPGGRVLLSEPNNAAAMLVLESHQRDEPLDRRLERVGFLLMCQRGKARLGEGDATLTDLLPGMLQRAGLTEVRTYVNDCADQLIAPYDTDAERALRTAIIDGSQDAESWIGWSRLEARRWFLAGGGAVADFDALWRHRVEEAGAAAEALREDRLDTAGGRIHYLISARRP